VAACHDYKNQRWSQAWAPRSSPPAAGPAR